MTTKLFAKIQDDVEKLRILVSGLSTTSIIGTAATSIRHNYSSTKASKLQAPLKQCFFLFGLMLTTAEPVQEIQLDQKTHSKIIKLLNSIFDSYGLMYWSIEEKNNPNAFKYVKVAMPAFLNYFTSGLLASVEQVKRRIELYISPFDDFIAGEVGISTKELLNITEVIANLQEQKLNHLVELAQEESNLRSKLLELAEHNRWSRLDLQNNITPRHKSILFDVPVKIDGLFKFEISDIVEVTTHPEKYIDLLSSYRGCIESFTYITDTNPAEDRPLFKDKDGGYFCPVINSVYVAILLKLERLLEASEQRESYFRRRDQILESEVLREFKNFFGDNAKYYQNLYETSDLQNEHDCVVVSGESNIYIVEAKASPPIEPFRDPEKAFTRLKRHFQSDRGIQKAFNQANNLRLKLLTDKAITLYDKNRNPIHITHLPQSEIFCICITRDDFGPLAANLDLLLRKDDNSPYPWVISIFSFESFVQGFKHLGLGEYNFCEYLQQRSSLHGLTTGQF